MDLDMPRIGDGRFGRLRRRHLRQLGVERGHVDSRVSPQLGDAPGMALLRELGPAEEAVGERLGGAELGLRRLEP